MKVGIISLLTALTFSLPAFAGSEECPGPDTDSDGINDVCDNCSAYPNVFQYDDDSDGFGEPCDCDFTGSLSCGGADFLIMGGNYGKPVPPCPAYVDLNNDLACDGTDFLLWASGFGLPPGPSCGNPRGIPCP